MKAMTWISYATLAAALVTTPALADDTVNIGMIVPMTGPSASTGKQEQAGAKLYMQQHGDTVAGKKINLEIKDDTGAADVTKRLAQELVANDHAAALIGFGLTPLALAAAPRRDRSEGARNRLRRRDRDDHRKVALSSCAPRSRCRRPPRRWREWALKNSIKKVVTIVTDYGPGIDAEKWFGDTFKAGGGTIAEAIRVPLKNPDFAPFLQRVKDDAPDAVFVFVPSGFGAIFMKQFAERGLDKAGIKLIGTGDVTDDDLLADIGDPALGAVTTHHYSAAHDSPENKAFVEAFEKANGMRPNFMAVGAYDGMALIYQALEKTKGDTNGDALLAAMKGASWMSPRGPVTIDPETRDIVQTIYVRKVEKKDGQLYNVEFETIPDVKDPYKASKK